MKNWLLPLLCALAISLTGCTERSAGSSSSSSSGSSSSSLPEQSSSSSQSSSSLPPVEPSSSLPEPSSSASGSSDSEPFLTPATPTLSADFADLAGLDSEMHGWGPGNNPDDRNRPVGIDVFQEKYQQYDAYFIMPTDEKTVYLTFDQGYENGFTSPILDVLKEKDVKAVFFLTLDYAKGCPELVQRMIDEGHVLGNHSASHKNYPELPLDSARDDLARCHDYVKETYHYDMNLFRFPAGNYSEQSLALIHKLGYRSVFWSFAYKDWETDNQPAKDYAIEHIVGRAHPGAIYLLHSVSQTNAEVLGEVIDRIRAEGYTFGRMA